MEKSMGVMITGFILIVVALALITSIADQTSKLSVLSPVRNDTFTVSGNRTCIQITDGCISSLTQVTNKSNVDTIGVANYTLCRSDGVKVNGISFYERSDPTYINENLNATYIESSDCTYVADSTSRTLIGLLVLFFAIAILSIGFFVLKNSGLLDQL